MEALQEFSSRTDLGPLVRFVDGMIVAVERGTPLADVLRAQAQDVRDTAKRELMESAGKKEIGMMVPLVFGVLPLTVVFAVFPGPGRHQPRVVWSGQPEHRHGGGQRSRNEQHRDRTRQARHRRRNQGTTEEGDQVKNTGIRIALLICTFSLLLRRPSPAAAACESGPDILAAAATIPNAGTCPAG